MTFSRLFRLLDPQALGAVLLDWVRATLPAPTGQSVIAVDGKTLRRSLTGPPARRHYVVSAWATESGLALGQWVVPDHTMRSPPCQRSWRRWSCRAR
ncbi:MAG: hypothetical protein M9947_15755 [Thermomicrobiales bacterium]|nr:hypothetical protein [Thermomicrobiales bacterium]